MKYEGWEAWPPHPTPQVLFLILHCPGRWPHQLIPGATMCDDVHITIWMSHSLCVLNRMCIWIGGLPDPGWVDCKKFPARVSVSPSQDTVYPYTLEHDCSIPMRLGDLWWSSIENLEDAQYPLDGTEEHPVLWLLVMSLYLGLSVFLPFQEVPQLRPTLQPRCRGGCAFGAKHEALGPTTPRGPKWLWVMAPG